MAQIDLAPLSADHVQDNCIDSICFATHNSEQSGRYRQASLDRVIILHAASKTQILSEPDIKATNKNNNTSRRNDKNTALKADGHQNSNTLFLCVSTTIWLDEILFLHRYLNLNHIARW